MQERKRSDIRRRPREEKERKGSKIRFPFCAFRSLLPSLAQAEFAISSSKQPRICVDAWGTTENRSGRRPMAPKRTQASERTKRGRAAWQRATSSSERRKKGVEKISAALANTISTRPYLLARLGANAVRPDVEATPIPRMVSSGTIVEPGRGGSRRGEMEESKKKGKKRGSLLVEEGRSERGEKNEILLDLFDLSTSTTAFFFLPFSFFQWAVFPFDRRLRAAKKRRKNKVYNDKNRDRIRLRAPKKRKGKKFKTLSLSL